MAKIWFYILFLGIMMVTLTSCGSEDETGAAEGGNISGELSFYTSQPETDATALVDAFNKEYPDVEVQTYRSGTEEVVSKVQAEQQAGSVEADVMLVADNVTFESLKEQDMLMEYESAEAEGIPDSFVDEDHTYIGTKAMATALAVNTDNVEEMPDSWQILTEDPATDDAVMASPMYSGAAAYNVGVMSRKDDFGWSYFENVAANGMTVVQGNGGALQSVVAGEKTYGMVVDFIVANAKEEGSPVELVYPDEGVPVITEPIGIMKETEHEETAKAFVDFVLSDEGQKVAADLGYTPLSEDVDVPEGLQSMNELNQLGADVQDLLETREEDKERFDDLISAD